jgi:hypothetical protein
VPVTTGMRGAGYYNQNSAPQWAAIEAVLPWLEDEVGRMALPDVAPIVIVDYGSSEGRNSIAAMRRLVDALRARTPQPIQVVHSDLPTNDFNQLFVNLAAAGPARSPHAQVYSAAVGGSMFEQLLPPATVTCATTFNAIGFLDHPSEVEIPDFILPMGPGRPRPGVAVSDEVRNAYAHQSAEDLTRFYRARADETVPGGKLLVATFGANECYRCCDGIYDVLNDALLELRDAGRIDREAYRRLVFPIYFRSREELIAPVVQDDSPVAGCFHVERAESMEVAIALNQLREQSAEDSAFASEFTGFIRAYSEPILRQSFRDQANLDDLIEEVYRRIQALLLEKPSDYEFHYIQVAALLTRL